MNAKEVDEYERAMYSLCQHDKYKWKVNLELFGARYPNKARANDAAYDLFVCESILCEPDEEDVGPNNAAYLKIGLGQSWILPYGHYALIKQRSSTFGSFNLLEGVIDNGYMKEVFIKLRPFRYPFVWDREDAICQVILMKMCDIDFPLCPDDKIAGTTTIQPVDLCWGIRGLPTPDWLKERRVDIGPFPELRRTGGDGSTTMKRKRMSTSTSPYLHKHYDVDVVKCNGQTTLVTK